jgi:hypothetical protein
MLACSSCRRFVRDGSSSCPFCGEGLSDARSPLGGFLGVILGVALSACGTGDDGDTGVSTANASSGSASATATGNDSTGFETAQPLYGPVMTTALESSGTDTGATTFPETTGPLYGPVTTGEDATDTDTDTDTGTGTTGGESTGTDTDASSGMDTNQPLYGPVSG